MWITAFPPPKILTTRHRLGCSDCFGSQAPGQPGNPLPLFRGSVKGGEAGLPPGLLERLSVALARWDGRGPTEDDMLFAGRDLADAVMAVLVWDAEQREAET